MKKIIMFLFVFLLIISVKGQQNQLIPNCSMYDMALYDNHPPIINDFEATALIQGEKEKIAITGDGGYASYSKEKDFFSFPKLDMFNKKVYVFLAQKEGGKRAWVTSRPYFFYSDTRPNRYFWTFSIIAFLLMFFCLLLFINSFDFKFLYDDRKLKWVEARDVKKKIVKIELLVSSILGCLAYGIYMGVLGANLSPESTLRFQLMEPVVLIFGTILSAFLYLGILSVFYWIKKITKQNIKNVAIS